MLLVILELCSSHNLIHPHSFIHLHSIATATHSLSLSHSLTHFSLVSQTSLLSSQTPRFQSELSLQLLKAAAYNSHSSIDASILIIDMVRLRIAACYFAVYLSNSQLSARFSLQTRIAVVIRMIELNREKSAAVMLHNTTAETSETTALVCIRLFERAAAHDNQTQSQCGMCVRVEIRMQQLQMMITSAAAE